jgi:hypothetical protein
MSQPSKKVSGSEGQIRMYGYALLQVRYSIFLGWV